MFFGRIIGKLLPLVAITAISGAVLSCAPIDDADTSSISLSVRTASASSASGSTFVSVTASGAWTLSIKEQVDWARLSCTSGMGNKADVYLTWDANSGKEARSCTVVLESNGDSRSATFTQGTPGAVPELHPDPIPTWMELPAHVEGDGLYFFTHDMSIGGKTCRNYSFALDPKAKIALWVAYPLNRKLIGSGSRSDQWGLDPKVPKAYQSVIYSAYRGGYERGHQIPSADRYTDNVSTFYGTNITPQSGILNENSWASLEGMVRSWSYQFDTLYVVTGADIKGSTRTATDNEGKNITVPVGYFKALLGYKRSGTLGITATTAGYTAIGFYFKHQGYDDSEIMDQSMTIDELESRLGYDFFANLPAAIGDKYATKVESTMDPWWKLKQTI